MFVIIMEYTKSIKGRHVRGPFLTGKDAAVWLGKTGFTKAPDFKWGDGEWVASVYELKEP
jgi:hypothetical protein